MAETAKAQDDPWSEGMSKLIEAARVNMTAYNLAVAGSVALAAGAVAYFWDQSRRNAVLEGAQRLGEQMRQAWSVDPTQSRSEG